MKSRLIDILTMRDFISRRLGTLKTPNSIKFRKNYKMCMTELRVSVRAIALMVGVCSWILLGNKLGSILKTLVALLIGVASYYITYILQYEYVGNIVLDYLYSLDHESKIEFCKHFKFTLWEDEESNKKYFNVYGNEIYLE